MKPQNKVASEYNEFRKGHYGYESHKRAITMRFFKRQAHKADRRQARQLLTAY